ncbi:hypothetical protein [Calidifontibacillus erzurumensis]|uniref:hypothetical protein n=1 Tax=Calidifontibacillus erzurumensis TaxID=2741433 RepID=UPI0035B54586
METFNVQEINKLLKLWKGHIKFFKNDGVITKIEFTKRYDFDMFSNGQESNGIVVAIEKVINGYDFLKVVGDSKGITVIATVKPQSLQDFKLYCSKLKNVETLVS